MFYKTVVDRHQTRSWGRCSWSYSYIHSRSLDQCKHRRAGMAQTHTRLCPENTYTLNTLSTEHHYSTNCVTGSNATSCLSA